MVATILLALTVTGAALPLLAAGGLARVTDSLPEAQTPEMGLHWNRTGLPLVFRFELRADSDRDYFVKFTDADTGEPALAAYFRDEPRRLLVPPGRYYIAIASGVQWYGEAELFGPGGLTDVVRTAEPVTFRVAPFGPKKAYVVDMDATGGNLPIDKIDRSDF